MNTIHVNTEKKYSVIVDYDLLRNIGTYVNSVSKPQKAVIISDNNVWPIYGSLVLDGLKAANIDGFSYIFPAGEESKNANTYLAILSYLAQIQITRTDILIALGGGVVGDITGFAAATYLRGIPFIQIPTTLLAMVDSSVGGKTAIDLPEGKNLVGAFYQPNLVLCDLNVLDSLPTETFRDGCAEIIKYGILYDTKLFEHLLQQGMQFDREYVISRCIALKRDVVSEDEFDRGLRQKLNLGHTIGHSIELCSHFGITHGQAVAIGMAIASKASASAGICNITTEQKVMNILGKFTLPTNTAYPAELLCEAALSDKKRFGNTINMILPVDIGNCIIHPIDIEDLLSFIKAGM